MTSKDQERELERALLSRRASTDPEVAELIETAEKVRTGLAVDAPRASRERTMFVSGVAARRRRSAWSITLIPIVATSAAVLLVVAVMSLQATPGEPLWRVRQALDSVGLARPPAEAIDRRISIAEGMIEGAAVNLQQGRLDEASTRATRAIQLLGAARALVTDIPSNERGARLTRIEGLTARARDIIVSADDAGDERAEDRSGPNRGPEKGDDDSGKGSDDEEDDDNSGPGSGDDGSDDGSNGSGDHDGDDGTGSGSDDSGSGSDDSSGTGSGSDDSRSNSRSDDSSGGDDGSGGDG